MIPGRDLRATLVHILDVEASWRLRLQRRPAQEWRKTLAVSDYRTVATLAEHWERDEAEMRQWVESLDDAALARSADLGPKEKYPLWYYLIHMVTHSQQHRAESAQLLTQLGHSPGDLDFLDYADSVRAAVQKSS